MSEPQGELRNPYTKVEQQAQDWPRSLLTRPGDNKRVCRSIAFACLCVVPTQLWLQKHHVFFYLPLTPCRTVSRSTQISAALHVHVAGLHMAHSQIYYLQYRIILPSDHAMDDNQCEPRQGEGGELLTRQRKRSVKALFLFLVFFCPPVNLRRGANLRVPRSVWSRGTPSKSGRLHPLLPAAATQIHGAQRSGSNKKRLQ